MQLPNNKLIISVAGSGKTTFLVREAIKIRSERVLITTYTEANEREIKKKFYELHGSVPANITIQTWFSFLLQHGVRPYQGSMFDGEVRGMLLMNSASGISFVNKKGISIPYTEEKDFMKHYFSASQKIYSDKISKFVVKCNEKSSGAVVNRLAKIFQYVFIDEVQDLAGNDLEILRMLFLSNIQTTMVGDPRQITYVTHHEKKYSNYSDGNIKQFILDKAKKTCAVDEITLTYSHRNNAEICDFSSKLYPELPPSTPCSCSECRSAEREHAGVFVVKNDDVEVYRKKYNPTILRYQLSVEPEWNFGNCKGLGFDRVLIYPTDPMIKYLRDGILKKAVSTKTGKKERDSFDRAKFYVALTRARYSVAIVCDYSTEFLIGGLKEWQANLQF